jgi:XTP/dITP diphosphohydrolase
MKVVVATTNPNKVAEIRAILSAPGLEFADLSEFADVPPVVEDGNTFAENAVKKAMGYCEATGYCSLADDSGLEVHGLGGEPGVRSARYGGPEQDSDVNVAKLLKEMRDIEDRRACFKCAISLCNSEGIVRTVEGRCDGRIAHEPRGHSGFGYDPVFVPDGYALTFAELGVEAKNRISHRAQALRAAAKAWGDILRG